MLERYKSWLPHGFDYRGADEAGQLHRLYSQFREVSSAAGFQEVIPPLLDFEPALVIPGTPAFTVKDQRGERLAIRSDITVQIIKAVANQRLDSPDDTWKLSYCQPIYRDSNWGQGHRREIMQAGVELISRTQTLTIRPLLDLALDFLSGNGFSARCLYGDTRLVDALLHDYQPALQSDLKDALRLRDTAALHSLLKGQAGPTALLQELPFLFGGREVLDEIQKLTPDSRIRDYLDQARALERPELVYDFALIRPLPYYSGPVFEGYVSSSREEVLSGGVYDALFGFFSSQKASCAGFAIDMGELARYEKELAIEK